MNSRVSVSRVYHLGTGLVGDSVLASEPMYLAIVVLPPPYTESYYLWGLSCDSTSAVNQPFYGQPRPAPLGFLLCTQALALAPTHTNRPVISLMDKPTLTLLPAHLNLLISHTASTAEGRDEVNEGNL